LTPILISPLFLSRKKKLNQEQEIEEKREIKGRNGRRSQAKVMQ
jgi:hypothetical protein